MGSDNEENEDDFWEEFVDASGDDYEATTGAGHPFPGPYGDDDEFGPRDLADEMRSNGHVDESAHDPNDIANVLPESMGVFASMSATNCHDQNITRGRHSFIFATVALVIGILIQFTTFPDSGRQLLLWSSVGLAGYLGARGLMRLRAARHWGMTVNALFADDHYTVYLAYRALGDAFAGEDGHKLVPGISRLGAFSSATERELGHHQRTVDSLGIAIDAYTAAAYHAKIAGKMGACKEVLQVVLDLITSLQLPQFSNLMVMDQIEELEVAICFFLAANDDPRELMQHLYGDGSDDAGAGGGQTGSGVPGHVGDKTSPGTPDAPAVFDFENQTTLTGPSGPGKPSGPGAATPVTTGTSTSFSRRPEAADMLRRAGKVLARKGQFRFAYNCHLHAGRMYAMTKLPADETDAYIDAGLAAAMSNNFSKAKRMLHEGRSNLMHCDGETARRWWLLAATVADAEGDAGACADAVESARLLSEALDSGSRSGLTP